MPCRGKPCIASWSLIAQLGQLGKADMGIKVSLARGKAPITCTLSKLHSQAGAVPSCSKRVKPGLAVNDFAARHNDANMQCMR